MKRLLALWLCLSLFCAAFAVPVTAQKVEMPAGVPTTVDAFFALLTNEFPELATVGYNYAEEEGYVDAVAFVIDEAIGESAELFPEKEASVLAATLTGEKARLIPALTAAVRELKAVVEAMEAPTRRAVKTEISGAVARIRAAAATFEEAVEKQDSAALFAYANTVTERVYGKVERLCTFLQKQYFAFYSPSESSYLVALGDNSAAGNSYVQTLSAKLGVPYKNLAQNGLLLQNAAPVIEQNAAEIKKADLITVGFGLNSMNQFAASNLMADGALVDWSSCLPEEALPYVDEALLKMRETFAELGLPMGLDEQLAVLAEGYAFACFGHLLAYNTVLESIRALSPDAVILIVGAYNPMQGVTFTMDEMEIDLGEFLAYLVEAANTYSATFAASLCSAPEKTVYVNAPHVPVQLEKKELNLMSFFSLLYSNFAKLDPAPAAASVVTEEILQQLLTVPDAQESVWGDADDGGDVDLADVIVLCQYLAEFDWDTGESSVEVARGADADGDGEVDLADVILLCQYLADFDYDTGESSVILGPTA